MACLLAKLLKTNTHLKRWTFGSRIESTLSWIEGTWTGILWYFFRLLLEWNCLGATKDSFIVFCESLASNQGLEVLDLRNNQLNAEAAIELAAALHKNKSVRSLDLRWNSIGVAGAKAIWDALRTNFVLQRIQLCGNFIPDEIICYIGKLFSQP